MKQLARIVRWLRRLPTELRGRRAKDEILACRLSTRRLTARLFAHDGVRNTVDMEHPGPLPVRMQGQPLITSDGRCTIVPRTTIRRDRRDGGPFTPVFEGRFARPMTCRGVH